MKTKEIRERFLTDNLEFMMTEVKELLQGSKDEFSSKSTWITTTAYEMLFDLVKSASDVDSSLAKSSSGVIQMLCDGDVTAPEAIELLKLLEHATKVRDRELSIELKQTMVKIASIPQLEEKEEDE